MNEVIKVKCWKLSPAKQSYANKETIKPTGVHTFQYQ